MIDVETLNTFVVVGNDFTWGKGKSIPEAKKNAKNQGGTKGVKYFAYAASDDVTVYASGHIEAKSLFRIGAI